MATGRPPTHEHLLTLANKVKAASQDGDVERLRSAARELYEGLLDHLRAECYPLARTDPGRLRVLRRGQVRLVGTASSLVHNLEAPVPSPGCGCQDLAELLAAQLTLQAEDERRTLHEGDEPGCGRTRPARAWSPSGHAA